MNVPHVPEPCPFCRQPHGQPHHDDCIRAVHEAALAGDPHAEELHESDECYDCLLKEAVTSACRCGICCRRLIIEVGLADAEVEPKIKERCSPIFTPPELTASGERELEGYLLNGPDVACVFLDQATNACTIYETRPLGCRLFDCDGEGKAQLINLGILPSNSQKGDDP